LRPNASPQTLEAGTDTRAEKRITKCWTSGEGPKRRSRVVTGDTKESSMSDTKIQPQEEKRKLDKMLDKALEESFPGSDPVSISQPAPDEKPAKLK
jgi:hypothetical protein